jgi:DNA-binding MarR family transcriptional regulator/N-acetylglutamate synthase-like GNAT family acetyltransferase
MQSQSFLEKVAAVRSFSRFYTRRAGILNEMLLDSNFGLTEARVLYEIHERRQTTAKELAHDLDLDPAYVSRLLTKFGKQGIIARKTDLEDKRRQIVVLTEKGDREAEQLDQQSSALFSVMINNLNEDQQNALLRAMGSIQSLLGKSDLATPSLVLRNHHPGDMGWIISAHGRLYAEEYGWDNSFEALVAQIASDFITHFKPDREVCWIAELDGKVVGSALIVEESSDTAKLRLVIVDPEARGHGIGVRLVEECMNSAKEYGYRHMSLWTNANLLAAINIYKKLGFTLVKEEAHHSFGKDLIGQNWSRPL